MTLEQASINLAQEAYGSQPFTWEEFCLRYPSSQLRFSVPADAPRRSAAEWLTHLYGPSQAPTPSR